MTGVIILAVLLVASIVVIAWPFGRSRADRDAYAEPFGDVPRVPFDGRRR